MATTAGEALLGYLGQQLAEVRRHDPGAREDQAEAVHQMRVAVRRLRSLLGSGRSLFRGGEAADLRSELRWLSGTLGAVRDPRVVQARLHELLAAEPADLIHGRPSGRIDKELDTAAAAGHQEVLAGLDSERYARIITGLECLLRTGALSQKASRSPRKTFRKFVAKDTARLVRAVADLPDASLSGSTARDTGLHEVRKAAKRLRYCAELAASASGGTAAKRMRKTAKAARKIQDTLGLHHDSVVARALLADLGLRSQPAGNTAFSYGRLHAREEKLAAGLEADFLKIWRKLPPQP